jgi:hypothetical protein
MTVRMYADRKPMATSRSVRSARQGGRKTTRRATVPAWSDGAGVCYIRNRSTKPHRLPVVDLPLWIGIYTGGLVQRVPAA